MREKCLSLHESFGTGSDLTAKGLKSSLILKSINEDGKTHWTRSEVERQKLFGGKQSANEETQLTQPICRELINSD